MLDFGGNRDIDLSWYGDGDMMCPFLSGKWFVDRFKYAMAKNLTAWKGPGQQLAGFYEQWFPITLVLLKGAGHMVPQDNPVEAKRMFENWIFGSRRSPSRDSDG